MTIRNTTFAAVFAAVLTAPGVSAQGLSPDSLARIGGLPADPNEFVRQVAAGERVIWKLFAAGCPSEGGWAGEAFAAMKAAAETDPHVQRELARTLGAELQGARELEHPRDRRSESLRLREQRGLVKVHVPVPECPSELPGYEAWLREQLRREWERGLLAPDPTTGMGRSVTVGSLLREIVSGSEPSTRELVRDIARDPEVWEPWREDAARRLRFLYFGEGDVNSPQVDSPRWGRYVDACEAALFDLAAGAPLFEHEWEGFGIVRIGRGEARAAFEREYEQVLRAAGREPFWE